MISIHVYEQAARISHEVNYFQFLLHELISTLVSLLYLPDSLLGCIFRCLRLFYYPVLLPQSGVMAVDSVSSRLKPRLFLLGQRHLGFEGFKELVGLADSGDLRGSLQRDTHLVLSACAIIQKKVRNLVGHLRCVCLIKLNRLAGLGSVLGVHFRVWVAIFF